MKRLLLASAAFAALTTASFAADLSAAPIEEVDTWSGFYVGLQGGFAFGNLSVDDVAGSPPTPGDELYSSDIEGPFGGAYYGTNWQFDNFVVGIDGSVSFASIEDQNDLHDDANPDVTIEAFSASRLRLGYAFDNFMIFAAGGFSLAKANVDDSIDDDDAWLKGFTVGGGIEAKFAENWSARVEYMFIHYGTEQRTIFGGADIPYDISVEDVHAVRGGIAYHF